MPRLFVGNFDFEHHLADSGFQPSARLMRLNAELATSWLSIAEDGDFVWYPLQNPSAYFEQLPARGLPRVIPVMDWRRVPAPVELIPWGWTDPLIQQARMQRWTFTAPPPNVIREVNSRQYSFDLETEWEVGLPGSSSVRTLEELETALQRAASIADRAVIKANWGMSGRERILINGELQPDARSWIQKRLDRQGVVFVEPWVINLEEIGIQIQIPQLGTPQLVGVTALVNDDMGQYRGSWFTIPPNAGSDFQHRWQPAVEIALRAAERLQDRFYFGPLGIDAMRYQLPDGSIHLRALQDINARWTMGQLSVGWRRFLRKDERGFWWHGPEHELKLDEHCRVIDLSLMRIEESTPHHLSRIVFIPPVQHD